MGPSAGTFVVVFVSRNLNFTPFAREEWAFAEVDSVIVCISLRMWDWLWQFVCCNLSPTLNSLAKFEIGD